MNPDDFFACLVFSTIAIMKRLGQSWQFKTACNFVAIYLAMSDPTVAGIPNLLETREQAFERRVRQTMSALLDLALPVIRADPRSGKTSIVDLITYYLAAGEQTVCIFVCQIPTNQPNQPNVTTSFWP